MKMLPVVSRGVFGGATAIERFHTFVSWGLMCTLPGGIVSRIRSFMYYYRKSRE